MSRQRVFVGPGNIAGAAMYVAKSLQKVGINAKSFSYLSHPFGYPCDHNEILITNPFPEPEKRNLFQKILVNKYTLKTLWSFQKQLLFCYALLRYDDFIFISHETFFKNNCDLRLLKFFKKKISFLFMGCPERDPKDEINQRDRGICSFCTDTGMQKSLKCNNGDIKKRKIENISNYADLIFAQRDTVSFVQDKNKIRPVYILSDFGIDEKELSDKYKKIGSLLITHIPSNTLIKGTDSVNKAIDELRLRNYQFNYFSKRINHSEVASLLKKTHILIDQFSIGHGLLAIEAMAQGCVVICRTAKWFSEDYPGLPLISCEPEELTDILIDLMSNPQKMFRIAKESMEYFHKFHTPEVVGTYYKTMLNLR